MAKRIVVEWMIDVPYAENGERDYDSAKWRCQMFDGDQLESARTFAQRIADTNPFGQSWLYIERADSERAPEWQWERDYDINEIFEAQSA